jgi:hypothetical protein
MPCDYINYLKSYAYVAAAPDMHNLHCCVVQKTLATPEACVYKAAIGAEALMGSFPRTYVSQT